MSETKTAKSKSGKISKKESKSRMKNLLMFLPNMFTLLGRLVKDKRVPVADKVLFAGAIFYVIMPLDFIPDVIPFVGQIDDIYLVALSLLRLLNHTDEAIVREHWTGGGDIVGLAKSVASIAPMLLPKRVTRVLSSKIELAPDADLISGIAKNRKPVLIETDSQEKAGGKVQIPSPS